MLSTPFFVVDSPAPPAWLINDPLLNATCLSLINDAWAIQHVAAIEAL